MSLRILTLTLTSCISFYTASAQNLYSDHKSMMQKINALSEDYPALCTTRSIGKSAGGMELMVLMIGIGDKDNKPGIAILGGIEGSHILGRELSFGFAETILKESDRPDVKKRLSEIRKGFSVLELLTVNT